MGQSCCVDDGGTVIEKSVSRPRPSDNNEHDQGFNEAEAMDPCIGMAEASTKRDEGTRTHRHVELFVRKEGPHDKLGMDVKHLQGRLVVWQVFPSGAVERANQASLCRSPPGDTIEAGDVIVQVNDVHNIDTDMINECQAKDELRLRAVRGYQH